LRKSALSAGEYFFPQIAQILQIFFIFSRCLCVNQRYQREVIFPADCADLADFLFEFFS